MGGGQDPTCTSRVLDAATTPSHRLHRSTCEETLSPRPGVRHQQHHRLRRGGPSSRRRLARPRLDRLPGTPPLCGPSCSPLPPAAAASGLQWPRVSGERAPAAGVGRLPLLQEGGLRRRLQGAAARRQPRRGCLEGRLKARACEQASPSDVNHAVVAVGYGVSPADGGREGGASQFHLGGISVASRWHLGRRRRAPRRRALLVLTCPQAAPQASPSSSCATHGARRGAKRATFALREVKTSVGLPIALPSRPSREGSRHNRTAIDGERSVAVGASPAGSRRPNP